MGKYRLQPSAKETKTVVFSTANTNRDGTGTLSSAIQATATTSPGRVLRAGVIAQGTTTAGAVGLYLVSGGNTRLVYEWAVDALTPGATAAAWSGSHVFDEDDPLEFVAGDTFKFATQKGEAFTGTVVLGTYS